MAVCTHRGSQDDEDVCVGVSGALLSIELPPELSKHLGASQRLGAHRLSLPVSLLSPAGVALMTLQPHDGLLMRKIPVVILGLQNKGRRLNAAT